MGGDEFTMNQFQVIDDQKTDLNMIYGGILIKRQNTIRQNYIF
jgi:hypothetical protein